MPPRIGPKRARRVFLTLWREHVGLTQEQLGQRFHPPVDKGTVSRWENAKPDKLTKGVIEAFAEAVDEPVEHMYRRPDQGPSLDAKAAELGLDPSAVLDLMAALGKRKAG